MTQPLITKPINEDNTIMDFQFSFKGQIYLDKSQRKLIWVSNDQRNPQRSTCRRPYKETVAFK